MVALPNGVGGREERKTAVFHKPTPMNVYVNILTFNEERNLPAVLDSVKGWVKEVFVVDSHSTDGTVKIAYKEAAA